ncbi:MAG: hypothetical protein KJ709_05995 [Nanoarchaeota archaeon]|nr:hypothetical protein [Nanoarchaeota archaeon]
MGMNKLLLTFLLVAVMCTGIVAAADNTPEIVWVKLDGDELSETGGNAVDLVRGEEFEVKVKVEAAELVPWNDAQIEVTIKGSHNDDIRDITNTFDLKEGDHTKTKTLTLTLPDDLDTDKGKGEEYKLRVRIENRNGDTISKTYDLFVESEDYDTIIKDIIFNPADRVMAGRSLLTIVRLKNMGYENEEGIKVMVEIPELGISAADYVDELDADSSTTSEELYMRIPSCVDAGEYDVKVTVSYDDGDAKVTKMESIIVTQDEACDFPITDGPSMATETVLSVPRVQSISAGAGVVYPVTISNQGGASRTYTLAVSGIDAWGSYRVDPSNVVVVPSKGSKTAYVYVNANDNAPQGSYTFALNLVSGSESKDVSMEAVVTAGTGGAAWFNVKKGLEIALVVLVVVLVILGLIIGFNKLRGDESEEEEDTKGQTYY